MKAVYCIGIIFILISCNENGNGVGHDYHPFYAPPAGTIIAADSIPIDEDELNDFYFAVKILSAEMSEEGKYNLQAHFGHNDATTQLVYPLLEKPLKPALKRDDKIKYSYLIGFIYEGDSVFHEYAKIYTENATLNPQLEFRYLRAYYVDSVTKD